VRAFASENRDGLRRRRPSDEFSHFELDQKRKEHKLKKDPAFIDTEQNQINFRQVYDVSQGCCADSIDIECRTSGRHGDRINIEGIGDTIENSFAKIGTKPAQALSDHSTQSRD
jgi:hypothetical protein